MKLSIAEVHSTSIVETAPPRPTRKFRSFMGGGSAGNQTFGQWIKRAFALASLLLGASLAPSAQASAAYGTLNNFDCVNDTGIEAHGFEIELDGVRSRDITYTYDYNHYGTPRITEDITDPLRPKVFVRYAGTRLANGTWTAYTAIPAGPIAPTQGHQFTNPAINFGGEHFGVGYYGAPATVRYNWLIDDGTGNLVHGPPVYVATPTFTYYPPAPAQIVPQVQAVIVPPPPPAPPVLQFGEATWVKDIKTSTHNANKVELVDLVSEDPENPGAKNWANGEPAEVETEWRILQTEFADAGNPKGNLAGVPEELPGGDEVVTRRYEFYKYVGPIDAESGEAMGDTVAADGIHGVGTVTYIDSFDALGEPVVVTVDLSTVVIVGEFFGAQMAGFDLAPALGLIDHIPDGDLNVPYAERTVVIGGGAGFLASTTGSLPDGTQLDPVTGIFSGAPTVAGVFTFTVEAADLSGIVVSKSYTVTIAGDAVAPVTRSISTTASPLVGGTTTGGGAFDHGTDVTVIATQNPGYQFVNWTEAGVEVSGSASYTFTVAADRALVANFVPITYTITTSAVPALGGSTSGGGTFNSGLNVTVHAVANPGFAFVSWSDSGIVVSVAANYTFNIGGHRSLVATFAPINYAISVGASPVAGGTVLGGGTFAFGSLVTVQAAPNAGYAFAGWTESGAIVSAAVSYSFNASGNRDLIANFVPITYAITTSASPSAGGATTGDGAFNSGSSVTVLATPGLGYQFVNWTEAGAEVSGSASYTFTVGADRALVGNFSLLPVTYTIITSASPVGGGTTSGGGTVNSGASVTVVATAGAGYSFVNWTEGGVPVSASASYTFVASSNRTLVANFAPIATGGRIKSFEVSSKITGGSREGGEIELAAPAPAGGTTVLLFSSNPSVLRVPASVFIPAGRKSAAFLATASVVKRATKVEITAKLGQSQASAVVKVLPRHERD